MDSQTNGTFTFVDLFAGVGGFAVAMTLFGGTHQEAAEIDELAANVYKTNFQVDAHKDVTKIANEEHVLVQDHTVLLGGFPCQPFSKSGAQKGMEETRGTLFGNIMDIVREKKPAIVFLENVRNLHGPRHTHEWDVIIRSLREAGYRVSDEPALMSPHLLPPEYGGKPQSRVRLFITATYNPDNSGRNSESPKPVSSLKDFEEYFERFSWNLERDLPLEGAGPAFAIDQKDKVTLDIWEDFLSRFLGKYPERKLPGFPLWSEYWSLKLPMGFVGLPEWKKSFIEKNMRFYEANRDWIDAWRLENPEFEMLPPSRKKFEWQAGELETLNQCAVQFRPSGVRVKALTHLPALVAITQTSVIPRLGRRISPREAARLQGFPDFFDFGGQPDQATYKQMGNSVNIGVVAYVFSKHIERDKDVLSRTDEGRKLIMSALKYQGNPDMYYAMASSMPELKSLCLSMASED